MPNRVRFRTPADEGLSAALAWTLRAATTAALAPLLLPLALLAALAARLGALTRAAAAGVGSATGLLQVMRSCRRPWKCS